jgi:hypothetical protein
VAYRAPGARDAVPVETLHTLAVSTARGRHIVAMLSVAAILCAVSLVVLLVKVRDTSRIDSWVWASLPLGAVAFGGLAFLVQHRRRRTLQITKQENVRKLVVDGAELTFPLRVCGTQITVHVRGAPMHYVHLQCVDEARRAVFFREVRGTIHGRHDVWPDNGLDPSSPGPAFDVGGTTALADLRRRIERINETVEREREETDA